MRRPCWETARERTAEFHSDSTAPLGTKATFYERGESAQEIGAARLDLTCLFFLCFETVIDYNTTSARPCVPVCNRCRAKVWGEEPLLSRKTFNQETPTDRPRLSCRFTLIPAQASHHNPLHTVAAILDGRSDKTMQQWVNTDHMSRQNRDSQPRTAVATRQVCNVRTLAAACHKLNSRPRLPLNPDRKR